MSSKFYINSNISDEEEDKISRENTDKWIFRLLLLVIAVLPLLIGGAVRDVVSPLITEIDEASSGLKGDIYTYYKQIFLITITVIVILLLTAKILFMNDTIRNTKLNIFIGVFVFAILVSTVLSPSTSIALWGQYNRSDGAISYLCYILLFFVAINIEYPKKALQYIMYSLYPFILINFILITMNFTGHDALKYSVVQKFINLFLPEGASIGEGAILLGTLNQWNYMSGMFAIMTVMFLASALIDKNILRSIVNILISILSLSIMLMSLSTSGFLTVVILSLILLYITFKSKNRKKAFVVLISFIVISLSAFHILAEKNPGIWTESIGFVIKKNPYIQEQAISSATSDYEIELTNRAYATENSFELPKLPPGGIAPGSGRVYIWEKTIDLLKEKPLFGYGLDTLMYHFPHYNIDARAGLRTEHTIVDKPHNMYIGVLYGTGIIGFIGFMGLTIFTAVSAINGILKVRSKTASVLGVAWLAFLVQAMFNDSLPGTAAPMWTLAGIMMAILLTQKEQLKESTDGRND